MTRDRKQEIITAIRACSYTDYTVLVYGRVHMRPTGIPYSKPRALIGWWMADGELEDSEYLGATDTVGESDALREIEPIKEEGATGETTLDMLNDQDSVGITHDEARIISHMFNGEFNNNFDQMLAEYKKTPIPPSDDKHPLKAFLA